MRLRISTGLVHHAHEEMLSVSLHIQRQAIFTTIVCNRFKKPFSKIGDLALADAADAEKCAG